MTDILMILAWVWAFTYFSAGDQVLTSIVYPRIQRDSLIECTAYYLDEIDRITNIPVSDGRE